MNPTTVIGFLVALALAVIVGLVLRARRPCSKVGHRMWPETRRGFRRPGPGDGSAYRVVAIQFLEERAVCRRWRCDYATAWTVVQESRLQGLSLPSDRMEKLEREGVVYE